MQQLMILSIILSVFTGCQTTLPLPTRPDSLVCVYDVPGLQKKCYNLLKDYDDSGVLLPTAVATIIQYNTRDEMLDGVNTEIGTPPEGWANIKAYMRELRMAWSKQVNGLNEQIKKLTPPKK